jgi:HSP20 family protein
MKSRGGAAMLPICTPIEQKCGSAYYPVHHPDTTQESVVMEAGWAPAIEISRNNGNYELAVELPGVDREDIRVALAQGVLSVRGEKKRDGFTESEVCRCSERFYGFFERTFILPAGTPADRIEARLDRGVLTIHIPLTIEGQPRKIAISGD